MSNTTCPVCQSANGVDAIFCEDCGTSLKGGQSISTSTSTSTSANKSGSVCTSCGAGPSAMDADGFCTQCGSQRKRDARDHFEITLSLKIAGVSDVGKKHHANEDFMALGSEGADLALIVCDGTSKSQRPQDGSKAASEAAKATILAALRSKTANEPSGILTQAILDAQTAICQVPYQKGLTNAVGEILDPSTCTIVAVLVQGKRISCAWAGDSRAYWVTSDRAVRLTKDHSWFNEMVDSGTMSAEDALKDKRAHAIVKCLGAALDGTNPGVEPSVVSLNVSTGGWLLIVSDGFWNYASDKQVRDLVYASPNNIDALSLSRNLVKFALDKGGHDNITVIAARF